MRRFRPAGRGRGRCYFLCGQKVTKEPLGDGFGEHLPAVVLTGAFPPNPLFTGDACLWAGYSRPAGKTRSDCSSCLGPLGPSSSQSALYSGRPSVGIRHVAPLLLLSPPNPLRWALAGPPIKCPRCTGTAYSGITVAAGQLPGGDHRRTKQVGRHQAVCNRSSSLQILMAKGPCGPRVGRKLVLILPAEDTHKTKVARSRK